MTREQLLADLLVERFGRPTPEHRQAPRADDEHAAKRRALDLHDATRRRAKPSSKGA